MRKLLISLGLVLAGFTPNAVGALNLSLSRSDMQRALTLGRIPLSDPDRASFHDKYVVRVSGAKLDYITLERIEIITEFRRLVLLAEQHAGLNDSFGRAGFRDVEDALRPWRGQLSIVAYLRFDRANRVIAVLPEIAVVLDGDRNILPTKVIPTTLPGRGTPPGERLEAIFDATSIGQAIHRFVVSYKTQILARVTIDFVSLE